MTDLDIASQKLYPIDKKTIIIDEIDFDDLSAENLESIKKEIDCVLQIRKLMNEGKLSLCQRYIRVKNKFKDNLEKDKLVLEQQHNNLMLKLRSEIQMMQTERENVRIGKTKMIIEEQEDSDISQSFEENSDEDEIVESNPPPKKKPAAKKKVAEKKPAPKKKPTTKKTK